MRLYHFTSSKYGLSAIQKRRFKVARIAELNDPFEILGWNLEDRSARRRLTAVKANFNKKFGLVCFSKSWENPLLWGHYADKHQGLALAFDVDDDFFAAHLSHVKYRDDRPPVPNPYDPKKDWEMAVTKFSAWKYEDEVRMFPDLDGAKPEKVNGLDLFFQDFPDGMKLCQVIVGNRSPLAKAELLSALKPDLNDVECFRSRPAFRDFRVVKNKSGSKLWQ